MIVNDVRADSAIAGSNCLVSRVPQLSGSIPSSCRDTLLGAGGLVSTTSTSSRHDGFCCGRDLHRAGAKPTAQQGISRVRAKSVRSPLKKTPAICPAARARWTSADRACGKPMRVQMALSSSGASSTPTPAASHRGALTPQKGARRSKPVVNSAFTAFVDHLKETVNTLALVRCIFPWRRSALQHSARQQLVLRDT